MEGTSNPYKSGTEYEQSKAYNADIVIIMLGTNDSKNWNEENYKTQMTAFYNEYKTENNKVILPRLRNVIRRRETISLRKRSKKSIRLRRH